MSTVLKIIWHCDRCHHEWYAKEKPRSCAKCKQKNWDIAQATNRSNHSLPEVAEPVRVDGKAKTNDEQMREEILEQWRELMRV